MKIPIPTFECIKSYVVKSPKDVLGEDDLLVGVTVFSNIPESYLEADRKTTMKFLSQYYFPVR